LRWNQDQFESAPPRARICTFCQDAGLRYTSISGSLFGRASEDLIGRTDDEIGLSDAATELTGVKRSVLDGGRAGDLEVGIGEGDAKRWFDLHVEPLRDNDGAVVGLAGTAVDVTEHKRNEAHLRMLMREITHRSKNLLAVIQAMARQTARHTGSIEAFLDHFNARLRALAMSHDLLVEESWHGASLMELVRLQLAPYVARHDAQLSVDGPDIALKPDAAQSVGLALHELATNAAKYGALSSATGTISVTWRRLPPAEGDGVEVNWVEKGGPTVAVPSRRGFGSTVIERNLARSLDAEVEWTFDAEGLRCRMHIPVMQLVASLSDAARKGDEVSAAADRH
jgi:PAS domain S-box-containing protein